MTPNEVTAAVGRLDAELAACARGEVDTHCDPGTYIAEIASADLRLLLQLLREAKEVVGPIKDAWNSTGVSLPPNFPEGQIAHIATVTGLSADTYRAAHSLATKLQGVDDEA